MAFFLDQSDSYSWPVTVKVPENGGKFRSLTFDALFSRVSTERQEELGRQLLKQKTRLDFGETDDLLTPRQIASEILVGWEGIKDKEGDKGQDVPFSESTKARLLNIPEVVNAILEAWNKSVPEAKIKN